MFSDQSEDEIKANNDEPINIDQYFGSKKTFLCVSNSKAPAYAWKNPKNWKNFITFNGFFNSGMLCGNYIYNKVTKQKHVHNNNITTVDIDYLKRKLHPNEEEYNNYIKNYPFQIQFGDESTFINLFNTFTVKTGSDGLHLIFQYEPTLDSKINCRHHIDLLNDDRYIISMDSIIKKNKKNFPYKIIHNRLPKQIPPALLNWLKNNLYDDEIEVPANIHGNNNNHDYVSVFSYDLSDDAIDQIINNLDEKYFTDYPQKKIEFAQLWCKKRKSANFSSLVL